MTDMDDRLNQWLRDAHAMERQAEQMLDGEAYRIENYPQLKARMEQHLLETRSQRERLEQCLARRGTSPSAMKDVAARFMGMMQAVTGAAVGDEVVKGLLASYTFEHMEIASYQILIAAAEAAGDTETSRVCEEICREEEAMAGWLAEAIPGITRAHLARAEAKLEEAKR